MADYSITGDTKLDTSGFTKGVSSMTVAAGNLISDLTKTAATKLAGLAKSSVSVGMNFDASMSQVAATMGTTVDQIDNLTKVAKEMGSTTKFTATQAADALNYLALAGYDADKAAEVLPSVLNLAAAGGMDLAYASDLVTDAMASLNIEANKQNVDDFGNKLAMAASKANANVSQLGEAILTVGGTAANLKGGTTELTTALGLLANVGIKGAEGGTHLTGFKTTFTTVMNMYARQIGVLKEKDPNFTGADIRNGMTAVVSIKHPDPRFEGQTKTKLDNQDAARAVGKVTGDEIVRYFDRNLESLKAILACAEKSAKIRKSEERAKTNLLTKQKYSFDSNGKLANCESRDPSICEIFIVEGDSAGGSAKTARDRNYQAILPIRGKILNVEKASIDKVLANAEIKTMINAFGCGFSEGYGNDFDITKLRYDKIIIMADADVDGAHISTLLLTLFYRFMPELIYEGHVYIAMPPLYKVIPSRGQEQYLYDDKALERYRRTHKAPFTLQRYKGLGEMDAEQLWETTLDPERRMLQRVEIEDARLAASITSMLMGTEVPPRKAFIYEHAQDALLDV